MHFTISIDCSVLFVVVRLLAITQFFPALQILPLINGWCLDWLWVNDVPFDDGYFQLVCAMKHHYWLVVCLRLVRWVSTWDGWNPFPQETSGFPFPNSALSSAQTNTFLLVIGWQITRLHHRRKNSGGKFATSCVARWMHCNAIHSF